MSRKGGNRAWDSHHIAPLRRLKAKSPSWRPSDLKVLKMEDFDKSPTPWWDKYGAFHIRRNMWGAPVAGKTRVSSNVHIGAK